MRGGKFAGEELTVERRVGIVADVVTGSGKTRLILTDLGDGHFIGETFGGRIFFYLLAINNFYMENNSRQSEK